MSDETKQPTPEEEQGRQAPETEETAPRQEPETAGEGGGKPEEPREEKDSDKRKKDKDAKKKEKEKTYTLTREQMEAAELAAKQLETVKDQYTRLAAEYDNYRKRTAKEKETIYQDAKIDTIQEFLAVYDNLERAVAAEGGDDSPHKKGMEMIFVQYKKILEKLGVTEIETKGQPFDPNRHNAVMHIDDENLGENVVAQVFQAGFMLGDKVVRHAVVQVAN